MRIILSPAAAFTDDTPPAVDGDTLIYRGTAYDLSQLPEGATVEVELPFIGNVSRINGRIELTLQYQYDMTTAEDNQSTDWDDYTFDTDEGEIKCPIVRKPEPEPEIEDEPEIEEVEEPTNDD